MAEPNVKATVAVLSILLTVREEILAQLADLFLILTDLGKRLTFQSRGSKYHYH